MDKLPSSSDDKYLKWSRYYGDSMNKGFYADYFNELKFKSFNSNKPALFGSFSKVYEREVFFNVSKNRWAVAGLRHNSISLLTRLINFLTR